jgi:AcrR family transcriptional regulator
MIETEAISVSKYGDYLRLSTRSHMSSVKPLRADARRNRQALLAKAREVFEAGDLDLRFDDFAQLAGVGVGTLYRHFPTREALLEAVYEEEVATLCQRAQQLQATMPGQDALAAFLRGMVDHMQAHQGLARALSGLRNVSSGVIAEGSRALQQAVSGLIACGVSEGAFRDDVGAGAVMMALHGISASQGRPAWKSDANDVITLLLLGLQNSGSQKDITPRRRRRAGGK